MHLLIFFQIQKELFAMNFKKLPCETSFYENVKSPKCGESKHTASVESVLLWFAGLTSKTSACLLAVYTQPTVNMRFPRKKSPHARLGSSVLPVGPEAAPPGPYCHFSHDRSSRPARTAAVFPVSLPTRNQF